MSGFETYLRSSLKQVNATWAQEFGVLTRDEAVQSALDALRAVGGDPNFALFVVTHFRWRRIKALPAPKERNRLLRAIHLILEGRGEWFDRLRGFRGTDWRGVEEVLREGATYLQSFHHIDESVFEARGTGREEETPRFRSDHTSKCLLVLDWHIRQAADRRQSNRVLLARLMGLLGMMKRSAEETSADPERWVEKRLERASEEDEARHSQKEYVEKFLIAPLVSLYHAVHRSCGLGCGSACTPYEGAFRAEDQERLLYAVGDAQLTAQRGDHALARQLFQQALEDAEKLLGAHHAGLVPILEGSAAALRALGRKGDAMAADARMGRVLEGCGHTRGELIGFQPGAGPNGELLPVWRAPDDTSGS
jgi:hypothetical protein